MRFCQDCDSTLLRSKPEPKTLSTTASRLQEGTDVSILDANQYSSSRDIITTVHLYRILQLCVFVFYSFTRTPTRSDDFGLQNLMPSLNTPFFCSTLDYNAAILCQFLPSCVCAASFNLSSSTAVHSFVRPGVWFTRRSRASRYLPRL
jgi:hypothetical protein